MSQPYGQTPPSGHFQQPGQRPGASAAASGAPQFQAQPQYVDYGNPRAYDTSVRPATGFTRARHAPAQINRPAEAQPHSAWATQTRRMQEVQSDVSIVPVSRLAIWIVTAILALISIVVLGLFFLMYITSSGSQLQTWPIASFLASFSLIIIVGVVLLADRWDPQPIGLILTAVLWGGAIATGISLVANTTFGDVIYAITGSPEASAAIGAIVGAPLFEESTKGFGLLVLLFLARRYFNGPLDGAIYGMLIGAGFAFTENILYYSRAFDDGGVTGLVIITVLRGVFGIFGHATYTAMTGIIMGAIARKWGTIPAALSFIVAPIIGMIWHASWNAGGFLIPLPGIWPLVVMILVNGFLDLLFFILIGILMWDEARLTRVRLGDYANHGWLTHEEVNMLATWKGRREGKRWAASIGAKPLMKRFIRESADLAAVRQRLLADGKDPKAVAREAALLNRLTANRQALLHANG